MVFASERGRLVRIERRQREKSPCQSICVLTTAQRRSRSVGRQAVRAPTQADFFFDGIYFSKTLIF